MLPDLPTKAKVPMFDPHTPSMILSVFPTDNKDQAHLLLALALMRSSPKWFACLSRLALPSQSLMPHCLDTENLVLQTGHCDCTSLGLDTPKHTDWAYSRGCPGEKAPPLDFNTSEWSQARNRNFPEIL